MLPNANHPSRFAISVRADSSFRQLLYFTSRASCNPWNRWVIAYVLQICYALASYDKITEGLEPIRNGEIFSMSNKEICMTLLYFLVVFI